MITEDEIRNQKIWDEVIKTISVRTEIMPHERTKAQLQREYNLGRGQIDGIIKDLLEKRVIKARPAMDKGKSCTAYSFVSGVDFDINP